VVFYCSVTPLLHYDLLLHYHSVVVTPFDVVHCISGVVLLLLVFLDSVDLEALLLHPFDLSTFVVDRFDLLRLLLLFCVVKPLLFMFIVDYDCYLFDYFCCLMPTFCY